MGLPTQPPKHSYRNPQTQTRTHLPAFLPASLPPPRKRPIHTPPKCTHHHYTRRAFLPLLFLPFFSQKSLADRTGKFSTKLTAKKRYLPRIQIAIDTLISEGSLSKEQARDATFAMELFGTTYYSEGNRISEREKKMTEATKEVGKAVQIGDWGGVRKSVGEYCRVGGLEALGVRVDGL